MTRPTQIGLSRPILTGGALGYDPDADTEDAPDPIDRASQDNGGYATTLSGETPEILQTGFLISGSTTGAELPGFATEGNILIALVWERDWTGSPRTPPNFLNIEWAEDTAGFDRGCHLSLRVVGNAAAEAAATVSGDRLRYPNAHSGDVMMLIEVTAGAYSGNATKRDDVASTTALDCGGPITPASGFGALIVGLANIGHSGDPGPVTAGTDVVELLDAFTGGFSPYKWGGYKLIDAPSGAYSIDGTIASSDTWSGVTAVFGGAASAWSVPAPAVNDGDDDTCETISGALVLAVQLDDTYRIVQARLRIATETAGSRTYRIFGANTPDFSDEVELASTTFTAIGSDTAQDVMFNWSTATAYRFYRLEGDSETRCVHAFELFGPVDVSSEDVAIVAADLEEHIVDPTDAHDASAVSIADTGGYFTGADVEAALQELGSTGHDGASIPLTAFDQHDVPHGYHLTKQGLVLSPSGSGWKQARVESPNVFWDPRIAKYVMVFVGYTGTEGSEIAASLGYQTANSPDGPWTEFGSNPFFSGSGSGADSAGCTGPFVWYEDGVYHLYYIGLTATGLEGGTKTICHATSTDFSTWTRHGAIISPAGSGWRDTAIWHPNIVKRGGTYYLFFNANGTVETIGYATSTDLAAWTVDDANSPILSTGASGQWDDTIVNDPYVYRIGETWYMAYGGYDGGTAVQNGLAYTSDADFPLGWVKYSGNPTVALGAGGTFDSNCAGRPAVWITPTAYYLWYSTRSAVPVTAIALATERFANAPGGGSGTVTSVGLTVPAEFSVSGSPVTTAGTLAVSKANQNPNLVYAGPASGGAAAPAFRALVAADIPAGVGTHYEPLTSGANSAPELVFTGDGRCVMVPVSD